MARIRDRLAQSWRRLSASTKQLVILGVVTLILVVGFILPVSAIVSRRMRASVDADLRHHVSVVRTLLAWEGYYLRAEARTLADFEGVDDALRTHDARPLSHVMATIQDTHDLDAMYVVSASGDVLVASAQHGPDPAAVVNLDLVQDGLNGLNTSRSFVADDRLWLAGAAPHVNADGWVDAVFFLAREIDHDYLNRVSDMLGTEIVLTDGQLVFSSLSPDDHSGFLATGWLPDSLAVDELRLQDVRIGNIPYRSLLAPLSPSDSPAIFAALLQPTDLIDDAIRHTVGWVTVLGALLVGLILVLVQFHIRAIFKPLQSLAQAAEVIAGGNLDQPLQIQGAAEVKTLATSFDQMRIRLHGLLDEQQRWNQELDAKVRARTREIENLYHAREQLLTELIAAQETLEAARTFQQSIIDGVAEPIMVIDTDYQVKLMNRAAREFSSGGASVSPSLHCYQVSHQREAPCDETAFPCPLEQVREWGQPVTVVHEHYGTHGEQRITEVIASPLWGEDGSFQGIIECMRDITERKRAEETLQQYADRLRALTTQLIEVAEAERQRVARELHDETSQALANLIVTLGTAARLAGDRETRQSLEQVKGLAVDTLEGVKRIVLDLRPRLLDDYGLMPAIRWYAEERLEQANIDVTVDVEGGETRLPPHAETGIFRVVQEAVNNIVRHAQATHAWVRLTWEPNRFAVEIEDDGRGFDVQAMVSGAKRNRCLGLLGMQERVALMDGTLEIESAPGAGTRILVQVPVP